MCSPWLGLRESGWMKVTVKVVVEMMSLDRLMMIMMVYGGCLVD